MHKLVTDSVKQWLRDTFPDLISAYLFGSYASGDQLPSSDIDFAVVVARVIPPYELWEKAQELSLLLKHDVDLVNLFTSSTVFKYQVIQSGQLILSTNQDKQIDFENYVIKSYFDFAYARNQIVDSYVGKGVGNG